MRRKHALHACLLMSSVLGAACWAQQAPPRSTSESPSSAAVADGVDQDAVSQFESRYQAAGSPRILLFWNVSFDDATRSTEVTVDVNQALGDQGVNGPLNVHSTFNTALDPAKHHPEIAPREAAVLESAFRQRLHDSGVRFIDRAVGVRFEAAENDREGVDPKLIESDAIRGKADILLEIVMVRDLSSPLGRGFRVKATSVATAEEMSFLYTLAQPLAPLRTGRYVGTEDGFKWQGPPPWVPSVDQVGRTLAQEVMGALAPSLSYPAAAGRSAKHSVPNNTTK